MTKVKVRNTSRGKVLDVQSKGQWTSVALGESKKPAKKRNKHLLRKTRKKRDVAEARPPESITGMPGGDKKTISLKCKVSFLKGVATGRRNFQLPMGYNGQEKILLVQSFAVGAQPKVYLKTPENDFTIYTSTTEGQGLHFICDGTYWYLVNTGYSTGGNNDAGEWTTN